MQKFIHLVLIVGFAGCVISCKKSANAGNKGNQGTAGNQTNNPVPVNLVKVGQEHIIYYDSYPATVVALKEVELRCDVGGNVTGIFFTEGKTVRKGQKLYEIDRSRYLAAYEQAKANVDIAQSNLEKTQRDADRYAELSRQDAIAKQTLDNSLTDLQNAKLQVISAKADLTKAETDLKYSVIVAPFDGTIGISSVRLGALVTANQTLLNVVSSNDPIGVDFGINESEVPRYLDLTKRNLSKNDSVFRILMPDNSLYPMNGSMNLVDRAVDPQTGTIKIRLSFPNPDKVLRPGMNCNAQVLNNNTGMQLVVPNRAVVEQMGEYFLYTVKDTVAKQIKVVLGPIVGPNVIIKQGVNAGETIVVDGVQKIHDGSLVHAGKPQPQGAGANRTTASAQ